MDTFQYLKLAFALACAILTPLTVSSQDYVTKSGTPIAPAEKTAILLPPNQNPPTCIMILMPDTTTSSFRPTSLLRFNLLSNGNGSKVSSSKLSFPRSFTVTASAPRSPASTPPAPTRAPTSSW